MKRILLALFLVLATLSNYAQFSTNVTTQDASCWDANDGSYTIDSIAGCFAPISIQIDSNTFTFENLTSPNYTYLNHGAGTGNNYSYSVWAGETSTGPIYIATGTFEDSISFDSITLVASAPQEMWVACFNATTSEVMWAHAGSGGAGSYTAGYAVTGAGDKAYVTGYFTGTTTIGNASITSTGGYQGFIERVDLPTGVVDTIVQVGGSGADEGYNIQYAAGRIYLLGDYTGSITLAGNSFSSAGNSDAFIVVMDTNLTTEFWSAAGGGSGFDVLTDVVAYENNGTVEKVYVTGRFQNSATFGSNSISSSGNADFFVATIDTNGTFGWLTQGGSTGADFCTSIDINSTGDRLYVAGSWVGALNFGGQLYTANVVDDAFIGYMDSAGTLDTLYVMSGSGPDFIYDLKSVDDDYLVFSGRFGGDVTFGDTTLTSNGNYDALVGKIGPNQLEIWAKNFGGSGNDTYNSIYVGPGQRVHSTGSFRVDCSAYQSGLVSAGGDDVVVTNDKLFGNIDTSFSVTGLTSGMYTYTMTDSAGNTWIDTVMIGAPDSFNISAVIVDASSSSATDGSIDLTVSGGTPGYTFSWSNGATTEDIDSLMSGTYCVTVTDSIGCSDTACFFVDSSLVVGPMLVSSSVNDLSCFGDSSGSIDLTVTGGLPPYSFAWSTGASTEDLFGLNGGTYTVTVTDNDTASYIDSFVVNQPDEIVITGVITSPTSGSSNDGAIDVTVTGGVVPYGFLWSNAATTEDLSGISIGSYTLTVTDTSGCSAVKNFLVDTVASLSLVSVSGDVTCINTLNGSIDLTVIGGVPPFTYAWSNGATTEDISGLAAGAYTVTVTDSVAQSAILTDSIGSNPIHPDPTVGPISGAASVQAWTNYNYSVPVSNGSVFNWSAMGGSVTSAASNAASIQWNAGPSGTLMVSETDVNGCMASDSLAVIILFVGVDETHENAIAIFPNPASEMIQVRLPNGMESALIQLIDLKGSILKHQTSFVGTSSINVSDLPAGSYIMRLEVQEAVLHQTIIIQ